MSNLDFFLVTMLIYAAINGIQALGLDMQFFQSGIFNFAFIVLVAVGAYATGIASLPPAPANDPTTTYVGGFSWGFPANVLFGVAVTLVVGVALGGIAFRRLRHDYLALTLVAIGQGLLTLVTNYPPFLNGATGLVGVNGPFQHQVSMSGFYLVFSALSLVALGLVYLLFHRVGSAPLGRNLKALREDETALAALGKSPYRLKNIGFLLGAAAAGLSGSLLTLFIGGWATNGWLPGETFVVLAAVIVGGRGRSSGALLGSILFLEILLEGSQFLNIGIAPGVLPAVQSVVVGVVLLAFLWWRPQGILPEQRERFETGARNPGGATKTSVPPA